MEYFEDFDGDEIVENFKSKQQKEDNFIEYTDDNIQLKHKAKNKFVFESFSERIKKLKIRLNQNIDKDFNLIELNNEEEEKKQLNNNERTNIKKIEIEGEEKVNLNSSNFKTLLEKKKSMNNQNGEFLILYNKLYDYCFSYLYLVNNYKKILDIIKEEIGKNYSIKYIEGLYICFDLIISLIKDIRDECYEYFISNNLSQIVEITKIDININDYKKFDFIDHIFTFYVNIFKFFENSIKHNFKKLFVIYSELLFNNNKDIKFFACQSLCYIIKNLDENEIIETFSFLFDIMVNPNLLFIDSNTEDNNNDLKNRNNNFSANNLLFNLLKDNKNNEINSKIFISDSISELLSEILINIKTISIKADLILYKLKDISNRKKERIETLVVFVQTFIKIFKKINIKFEINIFSLLHFFIINFYKEKINDYSNKDSLSSYHKFKSLKVMEQLQLVKDLLVSNKNIYSNKQIDFLILGILILSKELLLKNFKDKATTFSEYINEFILLFKDFIFIGEELYLNLKKTYFIEITCIIYKLHSNIKLDFSLDNLLLEKSMFIEYFLDILVNLNSFSFFQSFSLFSNRNVDKNSNDEYNFLEYDKNEIDKLFNLIINNSKIEYEILDKMIETKKKIFNDYSGLLIYEGKIKSKITNQILNLKKDIQNEIINLNENNYNKIQNLIIICKMINNEETNKFVYEIILKEICWRFNNITNEFNINNDESINNIFINDFYFNSKHFLNKIHCMLYLLLNCLEVKHDNTRNFIINILEQKKELFRNYGVYYSLWENIIYKNNYLSHNKTKILNDININLNFVNLLNRKNNEKNSFFNLYKNNLFDNYMKDFKHSEIVLINEIFSSIENLLKNEINIINEKKYSLSFEILISKLELLIKNEGINEWKFNLLSFILWFILGSYWITFTKSVWPILNKMLIQIFTILVESSKISRYNNYKSDINKYIINPLNRIIDYIRKYPSESEYINKNSNDIKINFICFNNKNNILNSNKNINILTDDYKTTSTFFCGFSSGLFGCYHILLNSDEDFKNNFINNIFINICSKFDTEGENLIIDTLHLDKNDNLSPDLNVLFNYIYNKESKTSFNNTIFTLKENLFGIMTKLENLSFIKNFEKIENILFKQIILSRSTLIQKYSVDIFSCLHSDINNYNKLLKEIIDNPSVIIKINNLEKIINDNNQLITENERKKIIPIMIRLYYSKYFNIKNTEFTSTTKKLKTRNKINLLNFFIQLRPEEFNDYVNIIFEPIKYELLFFDKNNNNLFENIKNLNYCLLNLSTFKKILEIMKINLKQITKLFENNNKINNISYLIKNCFLFMKRIGQKIKYNKETIVNNCISFIDINKSSKIVNYFDKEEFEKFFDYMTKNIKEVKKISLYVFSMIFNQFYTNKNLINSLAQNLCDEYKENLLTKTYIKTNSILKFFLSLSNHAKLHFIYTINKNEILKTFLNSLQSKDIERTFISNILDFFENIISPYSIENIKDKMDIKNENFDVKTNDAMDIENSSIEDEDENYYMNVVNDDVPITHEELVYNFNNIIVINFGEINKSLSSLIFNNKISASINDNLTLKIIEILLKLWSLFTYKNTLIKDFDNITFVDRLLNFILTIIKNDSKIFNNKIIFDNILKLLHIILKVKIYNKNSNKTELWIIYNSLTPLTFKINNFNSRLLLSLILKEFTFLDKDKKIYLNNILDLLIKLNTNKIIKRDLDDELDIDSILNVIKNNFNENMIEENIYYFEPIIYQLLILSCSVNIDNFVLNSTSLDKLKQIFRLISKLNIHKKFEKIINVFFHLLKTHFIAYGKIIYELFYEVNSIGKNELTGGDLFLLKLINKNNNSNQSISNRNDDDKIRDNFFTYILNFNIDKRIEGLKILISNLDTNLNINTHEEDANKKRNVSEYSIINFILPIIENFLDYKNFSEIPSTMRNNKSNLILSHKKESIKEVIFLTQKLLELIIQYPIKEDLIKELILFFFSNLKEITKMKNNNENRVIYNIDIFKTTNDTLTIILENIIKIYFPNIEFNNRLNAISLEKINILNKKIFENDTENDEEKKKAEKNNNYALISLMYNNIFQKLNDELTSKIAFYQMCNDNHKKKEYIQDNCDMIINENKFSKIINSLSLYDIITKDIYPTLKSLLYITEKRESKNIYYIRNYIIVPYINLLKLLYPIKIESELFQLMIELVNNLSNSNSQVRKNAREGIKFYISNLNEIFTIKFFEIMKSSMNNGYKRHIFANSLNYLLQFITNYKICELSLDFIMPILFDEMFGEISEEKEIGNLVNKYKEAKENKGFNSFELIGKLISIKVLVLNLVIPMKNYLMIRKNSPEMTQKVNEAILSLVKGIKLNPLINKNNKEIIRDLLEYSYILIHLGVEKNQQNLKEIKRLKNSEIKGNNIYTVDFKNINNPYIIEVANKFIEEKNEIIYSNLFAVLGLEFFIVLLKNKIFNFSEIEKNSDLYRKLDNILSLIFSCIKLTNNTIIVSKSIKIIMLMITENEKFLVIKKNLDKIKKNLFKLILSINFGDINLAQSVLSAVSSILTKFSFISVSDSQIKTLLNFLKINIFNSEIKPYVFNCFYSLIKRKIIHPDIYDMINYMEEIFLKLFDDNSIELCKKIFFDFINNYPLEIKGRLKHLNFFIINCESNIRKIQLNSINMLINFSSKLDFEGIKENLDYLLMKIFTLYSNSEDNELKQKIEELITNLYNNYNGKNNFKIYYSKSLKIIEEDTNENNNLKIFGFIVLSLLLNLKDDFIQPNQIIKILNKRIKNEINLMNKYIENKMNNFEYLESRDEKIQIKEDKITESSKENDIKKKESNNEWNILYVILVCIEKLFNNYINKSKINKQYLANYSLLFDNIIQSVIHPHCFIKSISLRLINDILLKSDFYNLNENQLRIILSQIKFIILSNPSNFYFEEKELNFCKNIVLQLISKEINRNNTFIFSLLESLTNDNKKWISNRSNGLIILNRVINLFEDIINLELFEDNNNNMYYLKPILELFLRIKNNTLAEDVIKKKCEEILEKINSKIEKNKLELLYKDIYKEINLLKQKRKMEQVEKFKKITEKKNSTLEQKKNNSFKIKTKKKIENKKERKIKNKNINLSEEEND